MDVSTLRQWMVHFSSKGCDSRSDDTDPDADLCFFTLPYDRSIFKKYLESPFVNTIQRDYLNVFSIDCTVSSYL